MIKTTSAIIALLALGACATGEIGFSEGSTRFGDAVRQNIAAQTVNPQGSSADVTASGARTAKAVNAYTTDTVEKPEAPGTMAVRGGGGATQ